MTRADLEKIKNDYSATYEQIERLKKKIYDQVINLIDYFGIRYSSKAIKAGRTFIANLKRNKLQNITIEELYHIYSLLTAEVDNLMKISQRIEENL